MKTLDELGRKPTDEEKEKMENNFTHHEPKGDQEQRYAHIRSAGLALAWVILRLCPPSREHSIAMTKLEECIMWANASIARNEK